MAINCHGDGLQRIVSIPLTHYWETLWAYLYIDSSSEEGGMAGRGNRSVKSYPLRRSAYVHNRESCVCVDMEKSLGADKILIYLVQVFFFCHLSFFISSLYLLLHFSFFFLSFMLFFLSVSLDFAADSKGISHPFSGDPFDRFASSY